MFIALWPDAATQAGFQAAGRNAVAGAGARAVPAESLHLTLAFLGQVEAERSDAVAQALAGVAARHAPFELAMSRIGFFERARALWLGGLSTAPLSALVGDLKDQLACAGFPTDRRRFQPHVTLARHLEEVDPDAPETKLGLGPLAEPLVWAVDGISLVASDLDSTGPRYNVLEHWPLGGD